VYIASHVILICTLTPTHTLFHTPTHTFTLLCRYYLRLHGGDLLAAEKPDLHCMPQRFYPPLALLSRVKPFFHLLPTVCCLQSAFSRLVSAVLSLTLLRRCPMCAPPLFHLSAGQACANTASAPTTCGAGTYSRVGDVGCTACAAGFSCSTPSAEPVACTLFSPLHRFPHSAITSFNT
jgi:hypothetical protein